MTLITETKRLGAQAIAESLVGHGIKRIHVFPGGTIAPMLDSSIALGIDVFTARHEQGAGYAALAAARLSGEPQVVMVTSGPGVTNVVSPVADAYFDSTPLLVLTGQVGTGDLSVDLPVRQRGFQEVDTVGLMRPITKAQLQPRSPDDVPAMIEEAFRIAAEGRPGPVLLDLPMDTQRGETTETAEASDATPGDAADPEARAVDEACEWLLAAERPVILAGQGVLLAHAHTELRELAERGGIPVSQSLLGLGAFPTTSPLALGYHGHTGNQFAGKALQEADLVLVVGSRLDLRQTGTEVDSFAPGARIIRIETDQAEIDHSRIRFDLAIQADAKSTLRALNAKLAELEHPDWSEWRSRIAGWRERFALEVRGDSPLKPQHVIDVANRLTRDEPSVICVTGVGSHQQWAARHFDLDFPTRTLLTSGGHGTMGYDLPTANGAQLARPDAMVICFVGDGSFQLNIQELAATVEHGLPIKIIVLDNHRLAIVSQFQKLNWDSDPTCGDKWNPDFAAIAQAYGIPSATVDGGEDVEEALRVALSTPGPALIHCLVDEAEDVSPMLMAGQRMDQMWPDGSTE